MKDNLEKGQQASHDAVLQRAELFLQRCLVDGSLTFVEEEDEDNDSDE